MTTRGSREILSIINIKDEGDGVVVAKNCQGLITIGDFPQLNEKSVEGFCRVLLRPGGTTRGVYNPVVAVSAMADTNLEGMIYYIKHFKRIGRMCMNVDVDITKVRAIYHQRDMK